MIYKAAAKYFFLFFSFFLTSSYCFEQDIPFRNLSIENGLSQNSVIAIAQDKKGFLWFGTRYGLNRYDGNEFKTFKKNSSDPKSISDNLINSIIVDNDSIIWVGTSNGLNKFNLRNEKFEHFYLHPTNNNTKASNAINYIYRDRENNIWVGTREDLFLLTDKQKNIFKPILRNKIQNSDNFIRTLFEDSEGYLWIGTSSGLIKMDIKRNDYPCQTFVHSNSNSLSENYITTISEDLQGNIWVGTLNRGVNVYNKKTNSFSHILQGSGIILHNNVRKILRDYSGKLWIGTQDGLSIYNPVTNKSILCQNNTEIQSSITNNSIHSIFQDIQGTIWIGTYHGGVNIVYSHITPFTIYQNKHTKNSLSSNVVSSIVEDTNNKFWIGTEGGGLNYFNKSNNSFRFYKNIPGDFTSLSSNLIKIIYKDKSNALLIGTSYGGGINLFDAVNKKFRHITVSRSTMYKDIINFDEVVALLEDSKGTLWVGSLSGLTILNKKNGQYNSCTSYTPLEKQLHNKNVRVLFEDSHKNLWIGTESGLHLLKNNSSNLITFLRNEGNDKSLQSDGINCIAEDGKHRMWIGTYYGGLSMYNPKDETFITYTDKNGLPNNNVLGILEDKEGNLWLSTDNGLSKFYVNEKVFKNYTVSDGIAGNKFNNNSFFKSSTAGEMFFGGNNGLTSFTPSIIEVNRYCGTVVFTSLKLFDKLINIGSDDKLLSEDICFSHKITFEHDQNIFTIGFALLNYIKPEKNNYAYMLEGFEKRWNFTKNPSASYNNLPPGDYTLLVKAANNDGIWNESPVTLHIKILPPLWLTWWAYTLYTIAIILIIVFVMRFLWIRETYKREEELQQFKLNFFTNISHEISTHLTLISAPIEKILTDQTENNSVKKQLIHVKKNADRLLNLVRELMDFRKAETNNLPLRVTENNLILFIQEIITSFEELAESKKINLSFIHSSTSIPLYFDINQMEKVVFNLLTNAFKFTQNNGNISIQIIDKKDDVIIKIVDDGRGVAPENIKKLFINFFQVNDELRHNTGYGIGLALAKSIVELHKGTITVQSQLAKEGKKGHTIFIITLQKGREHFLPNEIEPNDGIIGTSEKVRENTNAISAINNDMDGSENAKKQVVLLVEDHEEVRTFINESLSNLYDVIESKNGVEGLAAAFENIPDIIISDVMMPKMDGLTLAKKLKSDERTNHIPIILLTAKTSEDNRVEGFETGVEAYITKPFSLKMLELQVYNLIESRKAIREKFSKQFLLEPNKIIANTADEDFLRKVISIIEKYMDDIEFGVVMLSEKVAMSQPVLYKKMKALTNMSVNDFIKNIRLKRAAQLLEQKQMTVYEIAYSVGYNDRKYFSQEFKKQFGCTPSEYMKNH